MMRGSSFKFRPVAFLDRSVERVAVDVGDAELFDFSMAHKARAAAARAGLIRRVDDLAAVAAERACHVLSAEFCHCARVPC